MAKLERHGWLRDALADKGKKASDLAKAWGVDDSMVSRFISKGEPIPTFPRMEILCRILDMDMNALAVKLASKPVPRAVLDDEKPSFTINHELAHLKLTAETVEKVIDDAIKLASKYYGPRGYQVTVCIEKSGG